jgi:hypothetical protein
VARVEQTLDVIHTIFRGIVYVPPTMATRMTGGMEHSRFATCSLRFLGAELFGSSFLGQDAGMLAVAFEIGNDCMTRWGR